MTIKYIAAQLHDLSVAGYFNGEKFSKRELENYIAMNLRTSDKLIMEISLPDGRWFFKVERYGSRRDEYEYWIPDTRSQEERIKDELFA